VVVAVVLVAVVLEVLEQALLFLLPPAILTPLQ
jgi:hypothetical protein